MHGAEPLLVEGEKKSLAVAQLDLPAIGLESAWGWHQKDSRDLLADFDDVGLAGRTVEMVPDSDWQTNPRIERSIRQFAEALRRRGARDRIVMVPREFKGVDDFLVSRGHSLAFTTRHRDELLYCHEWGQWLR